MNSLLSLGRNTFLSLSVRNYRLYFIGQSISMCGSWMQTVALGWLVLQVTGSGVLLGTVLAFRYFPMLFGGLWGGLIVDRFDKRRLLLITQVMLALLSLIMSMLIFSHVLEFWMICLIALVTGIVSAVDNPARQTFVHEMVGPEHLRNAVTLNSMLANLARFIGPLVAGVLIATVGLAVCFLADALSFCALIATLLMMRTGELHTERTEGHAPSKLNEVLPYIASEPLIRDLLIAIAVIGALSYEFQVSLPLLAQVTFAGSAADYAALMAAMGIGSVIGGLLSAGKRTVAANEFVPWALFFGISICAVAIMPSFGLAVLFMLFVGFFSIHMAAIVNTLLQLASSARMRGRVMSLWSMAFFGSTLIGAPIIGYVGQYAGPRWSLGIGGAAAILAALYTGFRIIDRDKLFTISAWIDIRSKETTASDIRV